MLPPMTLGDLSKRLRVSGLMAKAVAHAPLILLASEKDSVYKADYRNCILVLTRFHKNLCFLKFGTMDEVIPQG